MKALNKQMRAFNAYQAKVDALNEEIIRKIEALPDNPAITRIGDSGNCFSIPVSALGTTNWSPEYLDFRKQYNLVRAIIENHDINQIENLLYEILQSGKIHIPKKIKTNDGDIYPVGRIFRFHPDVVRMLRDTLM